MIDWQLILVFLIVAMAVGEVFRRCYRTLKPLFVHSPQACGACPLGCHSRKAIHSLRKNE